MQPAGPGLYSKDCFQRDFKWAASRYFCTIVVSCRQTIDPDILLINKFISNGQAAVNMGIGLVVKYPKRITALVAALLLGGGGGAFAVASLGPDVSLLPVHEVLETVQPLAIASADIGSAPSMLLYRSDVTRSSDTADTLLKRLGVDDAQAATFLRSDALARQVLLGRSGRAVTAQTLDDHSLNTLSARWSPDDDGHFKRLVIERSGQRFTSRLETAALSASTQMASGTIQSSLFAATDEARIPDAIATQLAEIFSGDIDFHRALRKGDRFSVVYETLEGDGEPLRTGRVLSAEFVNNGKTYQAMWFQNPVNAGGTSISGKGAYYTLDGQSLRKTFLAAPLEFSRVTSSFKMRMHPILQVMRAHQGVDYGAPTGTPVRSVGNGVVEFAGVQGGYGNVVHIKHDKQTVTVYAHLSRIDVRKGQSVDQGQKVGAVGATGWATGPHLHFEFRINGQYRDPQTIARQNEAVPVAASAKPAFDRLSGQARVALAAAATMQVSRAQ